MKVSELMTAAAVTPSADYTGEVKTNMMILGIKIDKEATEKDYAIAQVHISTSGAEIDANTEDSNYLYEGKMTERTDARRTFSVEGKRYIGDAFQDWACSHGIKFGVGTAVETEYVYFNALTGKGESGRCTINVTDDGGGEANNSASFACEIYGVGVPKEYSYSAT